MGEREQYWKKRNKQEWEDYQKSLPKPRSRTLKILFVIVTVIILPQLMMYFGVSFVLWDITWLDRLPDLETCERAMALFFWFCISCVIHFVTLITCLGINKIYK